MIGWPATELTALGVDFYVLNLAGLGGVQLK